MGTDVKALAFHPIDMPALRTHTTAPSDAARAQAHHAPPPRAWPHHLTLLLAAVAMDGGGGQAVAAQEALQLIGAALGLNKHQRQALHMRGHMRRVEGRGHKH